MVEEVAEERVVELFEKLRPMPGENLQWRDPEAASHGGEQEHAQWMRTVDSLLVATEPGVDVGGRVLLQAPTNLRCLGKRPLEVLPDGFHAETLNATNLQNHVQQEPSGRLLPALEDDASLWCMLCDRVQEFADTMVQKAGLREQLVGAFEKDQTGLRFARPSGERTETELPADSHKSGTFFPRTECGGEQLKKSLELKTRKGRNVVKLAILVCLGTPDLADQGGLADAAQAVDEHDGLLHQCIGEGLNVLPSAEDTPRLRARREGRQRHFWRQRLRKHRLNALRPGTARQPTKRRELPDAALVGLSWDLIAPPSAAFLFILT